MTSAHARRLAIAAVAIALLAGPAGPEPAAAADDAATVNEASITVDEFDQFAGDLADAGLEQFAPTAQSQTLDAEAGRSLLTVLMMNEARAQFLAEMNEDPPTDAEIDDVYADLGADHPLQALAGESRLAVGSDVVYTGRLDAIAAPDVDSLAEQYEASPASLGVYCATALLVAGRDEAAAITDTYGTEDVTFDALTAIDGATVSDWQCTPLSTVADPALLADLTDAVPGEAIGPVGVGDGFAVLVIDPFDVAAPKLENFFLRLDAEGGETSVGFVLFQGFLLGADITVNPRYGRWDATTGTIVALGA